MNIAVQKGTNNNAKFSENKMYSEEVKNNKITIKFKNLYNSPSESDSLTLPKPI